MDLVVDIGNTRVKFALFEDDSLTEINYFSLHDNQLINEFLSKLNVNKAIVASVVNLSPQIIQHLKRNIPFILEFNHKTRIPVKNLYKTPETLGNDRIPSVIAAQQQQPASDILVIDTGTCIKYNFINKNNEFLGGAISPGIDMRLKALHTYTSQLPLVEATSEFNKLIGTNTSESILAGVQTAAIAEINEMINLYKLQFTELKVFLTGGDLTFFEKRIKNPIFVDPNLVFKGLKIILNFNA